MQYFFNACTIGSHDAQASTVDLEFLSYLFENNVRVADKSRT